MGQKIKITEEQLKGVINIINEQEFDDILTKFNSEKEREVNMSKSDAKLLLTLANNWCEGNVNHPDCIEIDEIAKKLKL